MSTTITTAQQWADRLNQLTAQRAQQYDIDLYSAGYDVIDWAYVDGIVGGVRIANTQDCGEIKYGQFLSSDGAWLVTWIPADTKWDGQQLASWSVGAIK